MRRLYATWETRIKLFSKGTLACYTLVLFLPSSNITVFIKLRLYFGNYSNWLCLLYLQSYHCAYPSRMNIADLDPSIALVRKTLNSEVSRTSWHPISNVWRFLKKCKSRVKPFKNVRAACRHSSATSASTMANLVSLICINPREVFLNLSSDSVVEAVVKVYIFNKSGNLH